LALVVAAVVAIFAWGYLSNQSSRRAAEGWNAYFAAMGSRDPRTELTDIATRYAGTEVSTWARLTLADIELDQGTTRLFVEKKDARDELRKASELYRAVLLDSREPMVLDRATFGLARAHEALGTPETLAEARKEYRSIAERWPNSPYVQDATARANDLEKASTKNFYDWLAAYEPPRPLGTEPGVPGAKPDFLKDPLEGSSVKLPSAIDDNTPLPKLGDEPAETPAGDAATPTTPTEAPAAETPAAEPPASAPAETPAAPAAESPAPEAKP
jgi:hypothetical protein